MVVSDSALGAKKVRLLRRFCVSGHGVNSHKREKIVEIFRVNLFLQDDCITRTYGMMGKSTFWGEEELGKILEKFVKVSRRKVGISILSQ